MAIRVANLAIQLPDSRMLVRRKWVKGYKNREWAFTFEHQLNGNEDPLIRINKLLSDTFGIDPMNYNEAFVSIKRLAPLALWPSITIYIFLLKFNSAVAFQADQEDRFKAMYWDELSADIYNHSMSSLTSQKYTDNAAHVCRELRRRRMLC